jgi:branched-subunit amino acid transport protein
VTEVWVTIGCLAVATAAIRASGPVLLGGRDLAGRLQGVITLLAPALLAALVIVETFGAPAGGELELDARAVGVAAAGCVLAAGGSALPVVLVAAVATALVRALL